MAVDTVAVPLSETGIEQHGIERVPADKRTHVRILDNFTMWLSANLVISTVALGALAIPIFQMGFWDSFLTIVLFNVLGVLPVAFFSTLGPRLGLRQMTISRFSFGWVGSAIMALFNIAACIGWSAVNVVVGAQLVTALSHGHVPVWVSILVIAVLTTLVSLYGYAYVHRYERWAWVPMALIFAVVAGVAGPHMHLVPTPGYSIAELASFVSFGGAIYGFATGWSSYAADYNVNQPEDTPPSRVFWLTFFGVSIPCVLLETLGLGLTTAYKGSGGDLLAAALHPLGAVGTLMLVFLALSIIANNIPNDYSLGLTVQVMGTAFQRINRAVWTLIGAVVYVVIAIATAAHFNETLSSFLLLVAYWLGPWATILLLEHFVFRKGRYNVADWDTRSRLPAGWAALVSMACGLLGVLLGASQVLILGGKEVPVQGLIARQINKPYGMDVGFELGIVFALVAYLVLRPVELKGESRRIGA